MEEMRSLKNYGAIAFLPMILFLALYVGCGYFPSQARSELRGGEDAPQGSPLRDRGHRRHGVREERDGQANVSVSVSRRPPGNGLL